MPSCKYCGSALPTAAGLHLHIMQTTQCCVRMEAEGDTSDSSVETEVTKQLDATRGLSITDFNNDNAKEDFPVIDPPRLEHPISPTTSERTSDEWFQSTKPINKRVRVEDIDDEEAVGTPPRDSCWAETFPTPAGTIKGRGLPSFERHRRTQEAEGDLPCVRE